MASARRQRAGDLQGVDEPVTTTKDMGDAHEAFLQEVLGGRRTRGSGNQWNNQMDGRHNRMTDPFAFAWDGKSTMGLSIGVTRPMWRKAVDQAGGERPMLGLRFYANSRLDVDLDLVVVNVYDMSEMLATLNGEI